MSRGPGHLQRKILHELSQEPGGRLPWRWLRERFPHEVRQKSFYRAIRSLRRTGRIIDYEIDLSPGLSGRARYLAIAPIYQVGGRLHFAYEADRELAALAEAALRQLRTLASARGIRLEPSRLQRSVSTGVDAYRLGRKVSDYVTDGMHAPSVSDQSPRPASKSGGAEPAHVTSSRSVRKAQFGLYMQNSLTTGRQSDKIVTVDNLAEPRYEAGK